MTLDVVGIFVRDNRRDSTGILCNGAFVDRAALTKIWMSPSGWLAWRGQVVAPAAPPKTTAATRNGKVAGFGTLVC